MRRFRLGSVFGIPIELDLTFLVVLPVFAWIIGSRIGQRIAILNRVLGTNLAAEPLSTGLTPWILGAIAATGLFVGVVLHELGHSLTATSFGYDIESITLWIFGGISQFSDVPEDWRDELAIAVAGPAVSVVLGVLSYVAFRQLPAGMDALGFLLAYLGLINVALAAFNMLPGFPLDGGRVLRAVLAINRPYAEATRLAATVGKGFAVLLGIAGLLGGNIILIGIALFVYMGAASEATQTVMKAALEGIEAREIMTPAETVATVSPDDSVASLLERMFRQAHTGFPVVDDGELVGLVTLDDARTVEPDARDSTPVADVMETDFPTASEAESVMDVFESMQDADSGLHVVLDVDGSLAGVISRTDVMAAYEVTESSDTDDTQLRDRISSSPRFGSSTSPAE